MIDQKKAGVILSYVNTVLSLGVTVFLTPFLIKSLGESEYGVYKIVSSYASQLVIINFGIGNLVGRYVAKYNALDEKKEKENFLFMSLIIALVISTLIACAGFSLSYSIDGLFGDSLSSNEILLAKKLYLILVATTAISVFRDFFSGIILGNENFILSKTIALGRVFFRCFSIILLLKLGFNSIAIVATDLTIVILITVTEVVYCFGIIKEKVRFYYWDKKEFLSCMTFSGAIVLQSIVNQINQNIDSIILGATIVENVTKIVTLYSFALVVFNTYGNITSVVSSVFMPHVTRMVMKNATPKQLTDIVIKVGRYQMMMACGVIFGFVLCGKNFLQIWVGSEYVDAYYPALILIIPTTIPLIESVAVSILDAQLKRMARSIVLIITAVLNVISSVFFIKLFGYIGAAYGTALSIILGHGVIMNLYYKKKIGLEIGRFFKEVIKGTLPCAIVAAVVCIPVSYFVPDTIIGFFVKMCSYILVYGILLYFFAMNESEKSTTFGMVQRMINKVFVRVKK